MNKIQKHPTKELQDKILGMLVGKDEAINFVLNYSSYVEMVDDMVDENKCKELIIKAQGLASKLFCCNYWIKNRDTLLIVELLNNLQYGDITKWEASEEEWLRRDAKALSHCCYNMLFAVLILECGLEKTREVSEEFRRGCHENHKDDKI